MKEKNRFSNLLEHLMDVAEIKNYVMAKELQYDVSYISKWTSGRMLPGAKTEKTVIQGISRCIVAHGTDEGLQTLLENYHVDSYEELEIAIFDNLIAEYQYVRDAERDTGSNIAHKTSYYPKLDMLHFISKMQHPVLRRISSLEITAVMDLLAMEQEHRVQILNIQNSNHGESWYYPNVHFSMVLNINRHHWDYIHDVFFLIHMISNTVHFHFDLYGSQQAIGRIMFAVKDEFSISGMLIDGDQCLTVAVSEDPQNCETLHRYIKTLCTHDHLLVRPVSMRKMIGDNHYARSLLSPKQQLLIGHFTEHFLSDALFEEILQQIGNSLDDGIAAEELRKCHAMSKLSHSEFDIDILFYRSTFSDFAVTGKLDFFNHQVTLSPKQRLQFITDLRNCLIRQRNIVPKVIIGQLITDFPYEVGPSLLLSDTMAYLRLENYKKLHIINHGIMKCAFQKCYEEIWNKDSSVVISDRDAVIQHIDHVLHQIRIIEKLEKQQEFLSN